MTDSLGYPNSYADDRSLVHLISTPKISSLPEPRCCIIKVMIYIRNLFAVELELAKADGFYKGGSSRSEEEDEEESGK